MITLDRAQRRGLEATIRTAREVAEEAAADAVRRLGVANATAPTYLSDEQRALRVRLRAHGRTLGDGWDAPQRLLLGTARLQEAVAYEAWHRMLFGRFLVERGLLLDPDLGVAIARSELPELAQDQGMPDEWALVERLAAPSLPAVFKPEDPALAVTLAPEYAKRLRDLVVALPDEVFVADDSLGWTYQFWRAAEKDAVNKAGGKIGAAELSAVTQLFTDPYMVKFLLHNTLGAWWAGKVLAANSDLSRTAPDEQALREACALPGVAWEFLRFVRDGDGEAGPWRPAAGTFPGWPQLAAEITFLDPCCGSGHFLVEAFKLLAALRQAEEGLSKEEAARAVIRNNLHGLEIDGRCVQIAAFNVALAAWRLAGGPITLPQPHIAWVGAQPPSRAEMQALANGDTALRHALGALHDQFAQAPLLGSLLEVGARDLLDAGLRERGDAALEKLRSAEPERAEGAVAARGLLDAADLLAKRYVLLATNVPFLAAKKQSSELSAYLSSTFPEGKNDLANAMTMRMIELSQDSGAIGIVTPLNWIQLGSFKPFRKLILTKSTINGICSLGTKSFSYTSTWDFNIAMSIISAHSPPKNGEFFSIDVSYEKDAPSKGITMQSESIVIQRQSTQFRNPDFRITLQSSQVGILLSEYAVALNGMHGADSSRFRQKFWEHLLPSPAWDYLQLTVDKTALFAGREHVFFWPNNGQLHNDNPAARIQGDQAWGRDGIAVSMMGDLPVTRYTGEKFDISCSPIVPMDPDHLPAILTFCSSTEFRSSVRQIDRALKVTNATLVKIPFDLARWQAEASIEYPSGVPEPYTEDPTQWLFHGHPAYASSGTELQVALARLAGYIWPAESDMKMRLSDLARERVRQVTALPPPDADGLLTLHATSSDRSLADRLRALLAAAFGAALSPAKEADLVRAADELLDKKAARDISIEGWLRDRAFRQHCVLFQQRPFLWQIWDGSKGGFSAFLHYHRLDHAALGKLTHTLLGDWIVRMKAEKRTAEEGSASELQRKLKIVLHGEKPHDIFVRWKPLHQQPAGWEPDLNDGVRINIRPFIKAEVLRETPKINWNKDRGADPSSAPWFDLGTSYGESKGARINDHHLALADKQAGRRSAAE